MPFPVAQQTCVAALHMLAPQRICPMLPPSVGGGGTGTTAPSGSVATTAPSGNVMIVEPSGRFVGTVPPSDNGVVPPSPPGAPSV
jgi:hypothetical protein